MRPLCLLAFAGLVSSVCLTAAARTETAGPCLGDDRRLLPAVEWAISQGSDALVIATGDCILAESYAGGASAETPREIYSITKAMTAALLGVALEQGLIDSLDVPVAEYFPDWGVAPRSRVTLRHLATMTSGLVDPGNAVPVGLDPFAYVRMMPLEAEPGARWQYNNWAYRLLFPILAEAFGKPLDEASRELLFEPLGMTATSWVHFPQSPREAPLYVSSTARDVARFGHFVLSRLRQPAGFLAQAARPSQPLNSAYGMLLWLNAEGAGFILPNGARSESGRMLPSAPADLVAGFGASRHKLLIVPSQDLVIVRFGEPTVGLPHIASADSFENQLYQRVAAALGR